MARWSDPHNQLHGAGYCHDPEFHTGSHYISRGVDRPLYCVTIFMEKEVLNLQRHSWTGNVFTRQRKMQCSQETTHGQMQQRWVRGNAVCMHTSTASFIIPQDVVACSIACWRSVRMCTCTARVCARMHATLQERCARRRNAILEHASPVLGSGLGKTGQPGDPGIVRPGRCRGCSGARGTGCLFCPGALGAGSMPFLSHQLSKYIYQLGTKCCLKAAYEFCQTLRQTWRSSSSTPPHQSHHRPSGSPCRHTLQALRVARRTALHRRSPPAAPRVPSTCRFGVEGRRRARPPSPRRDRDWIRRLETGMCLGAWCAHQASTLPVRDAPRQAGSAAECALPHARR